MPQAATASADSVRKSPVCAKRAGALIDIEVQPIGQDVSGF